MAKTSSVPSVARLQRRASAAVHTLLILGGITMVLPFYWMVATSLKSGRETIQYPPTWIPHAWQWSNYAEAWSEVPFARYFANTLFISFFCVVGVVVTSCLAAYAFALMEFPGRDKMFVVFLSMMMVPQPVYLVSSYVILAKLGWIDTYYALIVPWTVNIFSIFLLKQQFRTIPKDLWDAATIDGCSRLGFLWRVVVPLSQATIVTVVLFTLIGTWNSFLWPLVVTNSDLMRPIQVGLSFFAQDYGVEHHLMMAAATLSVAPIIIFYFFAQKRIIQSFASSGLKE